MLFYIDSLKKKSVSFDIRIELCRTDPACGRYRAIPKRICPSCLPLHLPRWALLWIGWIESSCHWPSLPSSPISRSSNLPHNKLIPRARCRNHSIARKKSVLVLLFVCISSSNPVSYVCLRFFAQPLQLQPSFPLDPHALSQSHAQGIFGSVGAISLSKLPCFVWFGLCELCGGQHIHYYQPSKMNAESKEAQTNTRSNFEAT